jgi:hypothetical protein
MPSFSLGRASVFCGDIGDLGTHLLISHIHVPLSLTSLQPTLLDPSRCPGIHIHRDFLYRMGHSSLTPHKCLVHKIQFHQVRGVVKQAYVGMQLTSNS